MAANWSGYQMAELPVNLRKQLAKRHNVNYFVTNSVATYEAWSIASLRITMFVGLFGSGNIRTQITWTYKMLMYHIYGISSRWFCRKESKLILFSQK
jgi:hypothetical protein